MIWLCSHLHAQNVYIMRKQRNNTALYVLYRPRGNNYTRRARRYYEIARAHCSARMRGGSGGYKSRRLRHQPARTWIHITSNYQLTRGSMWTVSTLCFVALLAVISAQPDCSELDVGAPEPFPGEKNSSCIAIFHCKLSCQVCFIES